jgi:uncharacterized membrane protein YidH (DUF202 family)
LLVIITMAHIARFAVVTLIQRQHQIGRHTGRPNTILATSPAISLIVAMMVNIGGVWPR